MPILTALASSGEAMDILMGGFNADGLYGDGMNLYQYVGSNPVNRLDPRGLDPFDDVDAILMGWAAERAAFGQQLVDKSIRLGETIAMMAVTTAVTYLFPPAGVALAAYGGANAILDIQEDGINFGNAFDLAFNVAAGAAGVNASFGTISKLRSGLGQFRGKFGKLRSQKRGRGGVITDSCFVVGTLILMSSGEFVPIEHVKLGQSAMSIPDPYLSGSEETASIGPDCWREIHLRINRRDGGTTNAYLIRPLPWINKMGVKVDCEIQLFLPEMDIEGRATIISISRRPEPECGRIIPSTVTGKFVTTNAKVNELSIEDLDEPIRTTASHLFFSLDRKGWVAAGALKRGEILLTLDGTAIVAGIKARPSTETVYNLEVHKDHTFFVSDAKLWVHNTCTKAQVRDLAKWWGLEGPKTHPNAGRLSHGEEWFTDGRLWYTFDNTSHRGGVWKVFDRRGNRTSTIDIDGNSVGN